MGEDIERALRGCGDDDGLGSGRRRGSQAQQQPVDVKDSWLERGERMGPEPVVPSAGIA